MNDVHKRFGDGEENDVLFIIQGKNYSKDNFDQDYDIDTGEYSYSLEVVIKGIPKSNTINMYIMLSDLIHIFPYF